MSFLQVHCVSFKIINSSTLLLPAWRKLTAGTPFKNQTLLQDIATCWNSTYNMLSVFLEMKDLVNQFLDSSSNRLTQYMLEDDEWEAVKDLVMALKVCIMYSLLFSLV